MTRHCTMLSSDDGERGWDKRTKPAKTFRNAAVGTHSNRFVASFCVLRRGRLTLRDDTILFDVALALSTLVPLNRVKVNEDSVSVSIAAIAEKETETRRGENFEFSREIDSFVKYNRSNVEGSTKHWRRMGSFTTYSSSAFLMLTYCQ